MTGFQVFQSIPRALVPRMAICFGLVAVCGGFSQSAGADELPRISGVYPHLAMFNKTEGECGTGAVVPWADRLWVITYAPHSPTGSSDKLYEITADLQVTVRPESTGGTPANRMIHRESNQLFIGPYAIGADRTVRVIPYSKMFGRPTANARHLTDPEGKIYYATMEEGIYEVDVRTLEVTELWGDEHFDPESRWDKHRKNPAARFARLPGYHGKGMYSGQGLLVYANNGEHGKDAQTRPDVPSGVLAQWDGKADEWTIVRRNQFTDVTGPGGITGNRNPESDPLWSIGWDHKSLILMLLDGGKWHSFRLPKASHCYDGAHGWNTEWPRIREIGEDDLLMTMHGSFWSFPAGFSAANTAGIAPRSSYLKVIGDFARWQDQIVFGCDDTARSEFLNKDRLKGELAGPGQSHSNLWFVDPAKLDSFGPPLGRGAVWINDAVQAGETSEPFLFSGFAKRSLHVSQQGDGQLRIRLEVDAKGNGEWSHLRDLHVSGRDGAWTSFGDGEKGAWIRLKAEDSAAGVSAVFQFRAEDPRPTAPAAEIAGLAMPGERAVTGGVIHARGGNHRTLRFIARSPDGGIGCYDMDGELKLRRVEDAEGAAWTEKNVAIAEPLITADASSVLYVGDDGKRWRLPKGDPAFDQTGPLGHSRLSREVVTERNLLNVHGTFYELPSLNAGGFIKVRPVSTHNRRIHDFASYRGLLVLSGISDEAPAGGRVVRSDDGKCALWVGTVDDLWTFGKPRGTGGPWLDTAVKADEPSDPYLATGYDRKKLTLSHKSDQPVAFHIEADFTGDGSWQRFESLVVPSGEALEFTFPDAFGAYWLRVVSAADTTATARFVYD